MPMSSRVARQGQSQESDPSRHPPDRVMSYPVLTRTRCGLLAVLLQVHTVSCSSWYVSTLAGSENGFQDGLGTSAMFRGPSGLCVAKLNEVDTLFVTDGSNHRIRAVNLEDSTVSTIAGSGAFFGGYLDGVATNSQFNAPAGLAYSNLLNKIFIADSLNHRIRALDFSNGTVVSTAAGAAENILGTFVGGYLDGAALLARFNTPKSLAMARDSNNLFIADTNNHRIRVLSVDTGNVWTLAGLGIPGAVDGNATSAQFSSPSGVAVSPDGLTVFVADSWNHRIRSISVSQRTVTTLSGSAQFGGGFRDGSAANALFRQPATLLVMEGGDSVLVGDTGNGRVRAIDVLDGGSVETLVGAGVNLYQEGLGTDAWFASPSGMAASSIESTVFVSDFWNDRVRVMALCTSNKPPFSRYTGRTAPYLGTSCGWVCEDGYYQTATLSCLACSSPVQSAEHTGPGAVVGDASSCPWQCSAGTFLSGAGACDPCTTSTCAIGQYREPCTPIKDGSCFACTNKPPFSHYTDHGGDTDECPFECDGGYMKVGDECKDDTFWVAKAVAGGALGTGSTDGVGTWALFNRPNGMSSARGPSGEWFVDVADTANNLIRRIDVESEAVVTLAGSGASGHMDGASTAAKFDSPVSVATAQGSEKVFVADKENHVIRMIDVTSGQVTSLAGRSRVAGFRDGAGSNALFNAPSYVVMHPDEQHVLVSDAENHRIRVANVNTGEVTTLAGSGDRGGWLDGAATVTRFFLPGGMSVSEDQSLLYVADRLNSRLRAVNLTSGYTTTISGGDAGFSDGRVSVARMDGPLGVSVLNKSLVFADRWNHRVRAVDAVSGYMTSLLFLRFGQRGTANEAGDITTSVGGRAMIVSDGDSAIWMLLKCVDQFASTDFQCPAGEYAGVCTLDDPQVACTPCTNYKPAEASFTGPGFPPKINRCPWVCGEGYYVSRTSLLSGPQLITEHLVLPFYIETSPNYEVSFDVQLLSISTDWRYIVGLSATYLGCCAYGDRIPLIAVHPLDTALRVSIGGKDGDGNLMCPYRTPSLPIGTWNRVSVVVTDQYAVTYINGTAVSDGCLLGPREYHQNVRVDIGGEVSLVETVDSLGAVLDNVTYSQLHCKSCPTSECPPGYYRGPCQGFEDGHCRPCTPPTNLSGPVYFTSSSAPEQNNCSFRMCNMSYCDVGEYRTACGHASQTTCAPCLNTIPAYSSFSGPADPPTNATQCPYTCWSGFYRNPGDGACIPEGADVNAGQLGNVSGSDLGFFFGFRPSITFEATMRYASARIDDIIQTYREAVANVAQVEMRFVLVVKVEDAVDPNANVSFLMLNSTGGRRAEFNYIHVTTRVWTEQGLLGALEARLTEDALNRELVPRGLPLVFLNGRPTDTEYALAVEKYQLSPDTPPPPPPADPIDDFGGSGLSGGAIAGIVLGVLIAIVLFLGAAYLYYQWRLQAPREAKVVPVDTKDFGEDFKNRQVYERSRSGKSIAVVAPEPVVGKETPVAWEEEDKRSDRQREQRGGSFKAQARDHMRRAHTMKEMRSSQHRSRSSSPLSRVWKTDSPQGSRRRMGEDTDSPQGSRRRPREDDGSPHGSRRHGRDGERDSSPYGSRKHRGDGERDSSPFGSRKHRRDGERDSSPYGSRRHRVDGERDSSSPFGSRRHRRDGERDSPLSSRQREREGADPVREHHDGADAEQASIRQPPQLRRAHTTSKLLSQGGSANPPPKPGLVDVGWGSFRVQLV